MLAVVLENLQRSKGQWMEIARALAPESVVSYYSWLTKLAGGRIPDPSVNRIQRLYDWFELARAQSLQGAPPGSGAPGEADEC
ncbi:protein of unknown function [Ralstonia solanacearum CMR15]|nr:protein of unknown function [Ralstonia solanacearum CMR15]